MSFVIDDELVGTFIQSPTRVKEYTSTLVYMNTTLSDKQHTFVLQNGSPKAAQDGTLMLFDYLIYSHDDDSSPPSTLSHVASTPTVTMASTSPTTAGATHPSTSAATTETTSPTSSPTTLSNSPTFSITSTSTVSPFRPSTLAPSPQHNFALTTPQSIIQLSIMVVIAALSVWCYFA